MNEGKTPEATIQTEANVGEKISECTDIEYLRTLAEGLFQIIEDIDTMSDIAKGDDKFYRSRVEKYQKKRWKLGVITDGYDVFRLHQPKSSSALKMK